MPVKTRYLSAVFRVLVFACKNVMHDNTGPTLQRVFSAIRKIHDTNTKKSWRSIVTLEQTAAKSKKIQIRIPFDSAHAITTECFSYFF